MVPGRTIGCNASQEAGESTLASSVNAPLVERRSKKSASATPSAIESKQGQAVLTKRANMNYHSDVGGARTK